MEIEINKIAELTKKVKMNYPLAYTPSRYFYGRGKLLITGEYLAMIGAEVLACPTKLGQAMVVRTRESKSPTLYWKGIDVEGQPWFSVEFELWHFNVLKINCAIDELKIEKLKCYLKALRDLNPHFLRGEEDYFVETNLEFYLEWGLGSSSTLLYNLAQWASVSPFELFRKVSNGSGYDIACAQSNGPILYKLENTNEIGVDAVGVGDEIVESETVVAPLLNTKLSPSWIETTWNPSFKSQLFFIYLGNKLVTEYEVERFQERRKKFSDEKMLAACDRISVLTKLILECSDQLLFNSYLVEHEKIIGEMIDKVPLKELYFSDFKGEMKSLGAWGGDFMLVSSFLNREETKKYFISKGLVHILDFDQLIIGQDESKIYQ